MGHPRRLAEAGPVLRSKFKRALSRRYAPKQKNNILRYCDAPRALDEMPVNASMDLLAV